MTDDITTFPPDAAKKVQDYLSTTEKRIPVFLQPSYTKDDKPIGYIVLNDFEQYMVAQGLVRVEAAFTKEHGVMQFFFSPIPGERKLACHDCKKDISTAKEFFEKARIAQDWYCIPCHNKQGKAAYESKGLDYPFEYFD